MITETICPVCGYELGFKAWDADAASDEICPSCGIQFGYDDAAAGDVERRRALYSEWRLKWIANGKPWSSLGSPRPYGWNADEQLMRVVDDGCA